MPCAPIIHRVSRRVMCAAVNRRGGRCLWGVRGDEVPSSSSTWAYPIIQGSSRSSDDAKVSGMRSWCAAWASPYIRPGASPSHVRVMRSATASSPSPVIAAISRGCIRWRGRPRSSRPTPHASRRAHLSICPASQGDAVQVHHIREHERGLSVLLSIVKKAPAVPLEE